MAPREGEPVPPPGAPPGGSLHLPVRKHGGPAAASPTRTQQPTAIRARFARPARPQRRPPPRVRHRPPRLGRSPSWMRRGPPRTRNRGRPTRGGPPQTREPGGAHGPPDARPATPGHRPAGPAGPAHRRTDRTGPAGHRARRPPRTPRPAGPATPGADRPPQTRASPPRTRHGPPRTRDRLRRRPPRPSRPNGSPFGCPPRQVPRRLAPPVPAKPSAPAPARQQPAAAATDLFARHTRSYSKDCADRRITILQAGATTAGDLGTDALRASGSNITISMIDEDEPVTRAARCRTPTAHPR